MRKIDKYIIGCKGCVEDVGKAISNGAMLTNEEYLDYYFKSLLNKSAKKSKLITDKVYRTAEFLVSGFLLADSLRKEGYTNKDAVNAIKQVRDSAVLYFGMYFSVRGQDFNGVLYIDLKQSGEESTLEISSPAKLYKGILALCSAIVYEVYSEDNYYNIVDYASNYLFNVNKEILKGEEPKPFLHKSAIRTLRTCLRKNTDEGEDCKVIKFRTAL